MRDECYHNTLNPSHTHTHTLYVCMQVHECVKWGGVIFFPFSQQSIYRRHCVWVGFFFFPHTRKVEMHDGFLGVTVGTRKPKRPRWGGEEPLCLPHSNLSTFCQFYPSQAPEWVSISGFGKHTWLVLGACNIVTWPCDGNPGRQACRHLGRLLSNCRHASVPQVTALRQTLVSVFPNLLSCTDQSHPRREQKWGGCEC